MYKAIIVKLQNVRPHSNADRLKLATVAGNQVIVGLDSKEDDLGVYFDVDGQLTTCFMKNLNLHRHAHLNSDPKQSGMFDDNGRVRAQIFRGEKSEGFWVPLDTVQSVFKHTPTDEGSEFDTIGKELVCLKYISPSTKTAQGTPKSSKKIENQMFHKHFDTSQFGRNEFMIGLDDIVIVTEKLHGTSQRTSNVQVKTPLKPGLGRWICNLFLPSNMKVNKSSNVVLWEDMIGTRNVILGLDGKKDESGFYPVSFREEAAQPLLGNIKKGETFYYEVVGYEQEGRPIMGSHANTKLKGHLDKKSYVDFINDFGDTTNFSYGCSERELDIYVYRVTLTNEDGYSVDLSWDAVVERCAELGVKTVPEIFRGTRREMAHLEALRSTIIDGREKDTDRDIQERSIEYIKFLSVGKTRVGSNLSVGVCLRVEKGITPLVLKEKSFQFKVLEGIIKDSKNYVDTEEAEG